MELKRSSSDGGTNYRLQVVGKTLSPRSCLGKSSVFDDGILSPESLSLRNHVVFVNGRVNDEGVKDYKDCSGNQCSVFIRVDVTFDASRVSCTKVDSCPLTLSGLNTGLRRGIVEAQQGASEAREEASSLQKKLEETETAFTEAKEHLISAPDLVSSLRSLTDAVKAVHDEVRTSSERTVEAVARRPPDGRRSMKTLQQMRRVLHDIKRYPRRQRRGRAAGAADDGGGATKRGRICYICRCKGHMAKDCPRVRTTDTVASADPTVSDTQPRSDVAEELNAASAYSGLNILSFFRRNFTSGID